MSSWEFKEKREIYSNKPSTLQKLKNVVRDLTPKFAICETASSTGGLTIASSAGSLPRNRQQASNLRWCTEDSNKPQLFSMQEERSTICSDEYVQGE